MQPKSSPLIFAGFLHKYRRILPFFQIIHQEGESHFINRPLSILWVRVAFLLALVGIILGLNQLNLVTLLAWTDSVFEKSNYRALLAGYCVTYVLISVIDKDLRKPILLVFSLFALFYFQPVFAALSIFYFVLLYQVVFSAWQRYLKLGFILLTYLVWGVVTNMLLLPDFLARYPELLLFGYVFAVNYTFRLFYFFYEMNLSGFQKVPFIDFLLYFIFAPYFIIIAYMFVIPRFSLFKAGLDRPEPATEISGIRHILAGIGIAASCRIGCQVLGEGAVTSFFSMVAGLGEAYILIGLMQLLGIKVLPPFLRPFTSESILEWWNRWNVHFRDFLVDLFFYPLMLKWRRRNPYLLIILGCFSVFMIGSTFFHWIAKYYFMYNSHLRVYWSILAENFAMAAIVALCLCVEKYRLLHPRPPKIQKKEGLADAPLRFSSWLLMTTRMMIRRGVTVALVIICISWVGYGVGGIFHARPERQVASAFSQSMRVAKQGDIQKASALIAPHIKALQFLLQVDPKNPMFRLQRAYALTIPSSGQDLKQAEYQIRLARVFMKKPDSREFSLLADIRALHATFRQDKAVCFRYPLAFLRK